MFPPGEVCPCADKHHRRADVASLLNEFLLRRSVGRSLDIGNAGGSNVSWGMRKGYQIEQLACAQWVVLAYQGGAIPNLFKCFTDNSAINRGDAGDRKPPLTNYLLISNHNENLPIYTSVTGFLCHDRKLMKRRQWRLRRLDRLRPRGLHEKSLQPNSHKTHRSQVFLVEKSIIHLC